MQGEEACAEFGLIVVRQSESPGIRPGRSDQGDARGTIWSPWSQCHSIKALTPADRERAWKGTPIHGAVMGARQVGGIGVHLHMARQGRRNPEKWTPEFKSWRVEEAAGPRKLWHRWTFKDRLAAGSTTMKLASALVAITLAISGTQAAPAGGAPLKCRKQFNEITEVGRPHAWGGEEVPRDSPSLEFSREHGGRLAKARNGNVDKLAFYHCDAVPGYDSARYGKILGGQVRSVKDPSQCVTISAIDNRSTGQGYERKNGYLTLRPCAKTSKDELMEQQWFRWATQNIQFRGKNSDAVRADIKFDGDLVYLSPGSEDELDTSFYLDEDYQ